MAVCLERLCACAILTAFSTILAKVFSFINLAVHKIVWVLHLDENQPQIYS